MILFSMGIPKLIAILKKYHISKVEIILFATNMQM